MKQTFEIVLAVYGDRVDPETLAFAIAQGVNQHYSLIDPIATLSVEVDGVTEFTTED